MAPKPLIRVIGSLNIDFVTLTPRVPGPGETLSATSMTVHAGGKGANQAVACGKAAFTSPTTQDVAVEMLGAVGARDPYYASLLKPTLEKSGVSTAGVREIEGVQTGTATIIVDEGANGENRILVVGGANARVDDLESVMRDASHDAVPDVVVMQGEIPRSTVLGLLERFNSAEHKTCVVFNPAPVFPEGIPMSALRGLAVLVVNETECLLLFHCVDELRGIDVPASEADITEDHLRRLTRHLHELAGISVVVVTLGGRGVFYSAAASSNTTATSSSPAPAAALIPAARVEKVVDTTGAGDTFVGYFATALARHVAAHRTVDGFDVSGAVTKANNAAARCVQRSGAMESIPFGYE